MSSKRTILLIDYDPQSIQKTRTPLQRAGYRVEVAGDGVSGLEAFDKLGPDLVLIEPMVPKKHGFQVCQQIKSSARGKSTPVLITTAFYKGRKHRLEAQQKYGCDGYLEKPITEELLLATCRQFLIDLPPLDPATEDAQAFPDTDTAGSSVISFPDLPLGEERHPVPLGALNDLSDDEIQARLDRMILEDEPAPVTPAAVDARPPAPAPRPAPVPAPAPAPALAPPASTAKSAPQPSRRVEVPAEAAAARQPARARPAVLDRPRVRAGDSAASRVSSRLPLWIGLAALACLLGGGAVLWLLPKGESASSAEPSASSEPRRAPAPEAPASLPEPEVAQAVANAEEPSAGALSEPSSISEPASPPALAQPAPATPKPSPTQAQAPPKATPNPKPQVKPASAAAEAEPRTERPAAEAATDPAPEQVAPQAAASVDAEPETAPAAAALPREGDLIPLEEVDVAPQPSTKAAPEYPRAARELRQEGTVVLRVLVSETGAVEQVEVDSGTSFRQLREEALRAVRRWRYEPALEQGVRVRVWITEQVTFKL
jgi:periplasmic protein TonB